MYDKKKLMSLKSLNLQIVLEYNDEMIELKHSILLDDSIKTIKEKLFLDDNYSQVPELINLQIYDIDNDSYKLITNFNDIIYEYYDNLIDNKPTLYINNLLKDPYLDDKVDLLFDEIKLISLLNNLKDNKGYVDLEILDLEFCLKFKDQNRYEEDINKYINQKNNERTDLIDKYSNNDMKFLSEFESISRNNMIDLGDYKLTVNDISIKIIGNNVETGIKGIFIKLNEVFNSIELSEQIPFIALSKRTSNTKTPQIKAYNNILNIVPDKEVKSWVLNEKKKLNQATYKIIKGLLVKSRLQNSKTYISINFLQNGEINVNVTFTKDDINYLDMDFNTIYDIILENVNMIIVKLNLFSGVFLQSKKINLVENSIIKINSIDSGIQTDFFIDRKKLNNLLISDFIRKVF